MSGITKFYFLLTALIVIGFSLSLPKPTPQETTAENPACPSNETIQNLYDKNFLCIDNCICAKEIYGNCDVAVSYNNNNDGVYPLDMQIENLPRFCAYCQQEKQKERPWMIIQRRSDGSENFYRNWNDYKNGFGDLFNEFWIGLERLYLITNVAQYELLVFMETFNGTTFSAKYTKFSIASESDNYTISVDGHQGLNNRMPNGTAFSTFDRDNDLARFSCALKYQGGWWFSYCSSCNLNGPYYQYSDRFTNRGIYWFQPRTVEESLKHTFMAIRPAE